MKNYFKLCCLPLSILLMSGTSPNIQNIHSDISKEDIRCRSRLCDYSSHSITTLSHVKNDTVATLTMNYEVYQLCKPTEVMIEDTTAYLFLYQADVYVNNAVKYKGGLFDWFDGCHAGFLNYINLTTSFNGISNSVTKQYFTPSKNSDNEMDGYRLLPGVFPTNSIYRKNSQSSDKQTQYNRVNLGYLDDNFDEFTGTINVYSNSYYYSNYDVIRNTSFLGNFDSRIISNISSSTNVSGNNLEFIQNFNYNNKITYSFDGVQTAPSCKIEHDDKGLYSGPCKNGTDEDSPFNFSFFGAIAVESDVKPSSISVTMKMDTFHGSHTNLDTFESNAYDTFYIHL